MVVAATLVFWSLFPTPAPAQTLSFAKRDFPVGSDSITVAVGDFNGDGVPDLVVANEGSNNVAVLLGNGDGTFRAAQFFPVGINPVWVVVGGFNGNRVQDLAVPNINANNISVLLGNGDGTFPAGRTFAVGSLPTSVTVGDFNGDGKLDLAAANWNSGDVSVLLGNGDGTFQPARTFPSGTNPISPAVGDFNRDGLPDLAVANYGNNNISVLLGNGDGTFRPAVYFPAGTLPSFVAVGQFNADGILDLAVTNAWSNDVSVLLGNGDGTFQAPRSFAVGSSPLSAAVADINGDGRLDLAVANYGNPSVGDLGNVVVLLGNGDGTFQPALPFTVGTNPESVVVGDFNRDGKLDLAVANFHSNSVSVLINTSGAPAPTYTLSASPSSVTVTQGSTGSSTITVSPLNGFTSSVTLSASGLPSGVTAAFSPNPTTTTSTLTLTANPTATTGTVTVTLTGTSGTLPPKTTTLSLTVNAQAAPDYTLSASPSSVTVTQGSTGTSTITVSPLNGFTGSVNLSTSILPSGVTVAFNPNPTTTTSTLTLAASSTAATGTVTLTITGFSGSLTRTTTLSLTVAAAPDYTLSASPSSVTVTQGSTGTSTITVSPQNGFTGGVTLSASGLPIGVTAAFSPNPTTTTSTLTLTANPTATTGTVTVTITGTSGTLPPKTTALTLTVNAQVAPDYTLSASPSSVTVTQGSTGTSTITVSPQNGFTGSVNLSTSSLPSGVTASFSPNPTTTTSTLTLAASPTATTGTVTVTITGNASGLTRTTTLTLRVTSVGVSRPVLRWQYGGCLSGPYCQTGWYSSPAVADLDGDGNPDVIWGAYDVVALNGADGSLKWRAPSGNPNRVWPGVVVADLTGNGTLEVVVARQDLTVYDRFGNVLWTRNPFPGDELRTLAVADLDNDGQLEIIVGDAGGGTPPQLAVFEPNGAMRPGWPAVHAGEPGFSSSMYNQNVAVADMNGDGLKEIFGATTGHYIAGLDQNGNQLTVNSVYAPRQFWSEVGVFLDNAVDLRGYANCGVDHRPNFQDSAPVIADVNGDGIPELIVVGSIYNCAGSYTTLYHMPFIFNLDRTRWSGSGFDWTVLPTPTPGSAPRSQDYNVIETVVPNPVVADLDGDGLMEIIYPSYDGRVHAYWLDKTEHGNWPYRIPTTGAPGDDFRFASEPIVVDLDNDGHAEVIFTSWPKNNPGGVGQLHILNYLGVELFRVNLPAPAIGNTINGSLAAPTIAHLDGGPDFQLVVGTMQSGVAAFDLPNSANARILWGTGRGNYLRDGSR